MEDQDRPLTERESLDLIARMINRARDSYYDTGISSMMWGLVIAICSLEKLAEIQFDYRLPFDIYLLAFVAVIPQIIISIREKKHRKAKTYDEEYMDYIWMAFGIGIFLLIFIINVIFNGFIKNNEVLISGFREYIAAFFLLLYGIPTFVTGAACKFRAMLWGGILCWACCIVSLFTDIKIDLLLTALSAIFAWFIPGIMMQQDYRKAKKELAASDV
jgi:hypothetical protein